MTDTFHPLNIKHSIRPFVLLLRQNMSIFFNPESVAVFLTRELLAILFIFQGYDKLFKIGIRQVTNIIAPSYSKIGIGYSFLFTSMWLSSFVELIGGMLLMIGLLKFFTFVLLGINLLLVTVGLSLINPVGEMKLIFPRFILLLAVLLIPAESDTLSLSFLIHYFFS